jgi:hypothetical protein
MKADTSSVNPHGSAPPARTAPASAHSKPYAILAILAAVALLCAFYSVVVQAVTKSHHLREEARLTQARDVQCSAFSTTASRDLCLVTVASKGAAPSIAAIPVTYQPDPWKARRPELSAGVY